MTMILLAAGCYTICSLADKYSVSKAKLNANEFTFIMAFSTFVFLSAMLPFIDHTCNLSWQGVLTVVLIMLAKLLEFRMATLILTEMSAFELKAWIGLILFVSYFTDIIAYGESFSIFGLLFIAVTGVGLFMIAKSNKATIHYKKIVLPLIIYLTAKFGYGYIIKFFEAFTADKPEYTMSSTMILYFALILLSAVLFPTVKIKKLLTENRKGTLITAVTKLPNAIGLFAENMAIATAGLTGYSLIQPIILAALFFIGLIRKESCSKLNLAGGIISVLGIICFEIFKQF